MQQRDIHDFLIRYFKTNDCTIIKNERSYIEVQLTVELDKELMNRPFYWHYLEKTGGNPQPMKLTLITDQNNVPDHVRGEAIHFGSPRLHQIFESTKKLASYIRMYQHVNKENGSLPLHPWLVLNTKISYQCDRKKDIIISLGLNLINGMIIDRFHNRLQSIPLTPKIPDYTFTLSPLIKPKSGLNRLENIIRQTVNNDEHSWAIEAKERQKLDMDLLNHFYEGMEEKPDCYELEKQALKDQYEPQIHVNIINGGLFYLTQQAI